MAYDQSVERWRPIVARYFRPEDVEKALYVIQHESGGRPDVFGDGGHAVGLFQHNTGGLASGRSLEALKDPESNIKLAAEAVYGGQGWKPWGENNTYQGKPFGALGNKPFPGGTTMNQPVPQGDDVDKILRGAGGGTGGSTVVEDTTSSVPPRWTGNGPQGYGTYLLNPDGSLGAFIGDTRRPGDESPDLITAREGTDLVARDKQTGKEVWRVPMPPGEQGAPQTRTINGRVMGWNPATKAFDIDYGPAGTGNTISLPANVTGAKYDQNVLGGEGGNPASVDVSAQNLTQNILSRTGASDRDVTNANPQVASDMAKNQWGNNEYIIRTYGRESTGDPIKDAALAGSLMAGLLGDPLPADPWKRTWRDDMGTLRGYDQAKAMGLTSSSPGMAGEIIDPNKKLNAGGVDPYDIIGQAEGGTNVAGLTVNGEPANPDWNYMPESNGFVTPQTVGVFPVDPYSFSPQSAQPISVAGEAGPEAITVSPLVAPEDMHRGDPRDASGAGPNLFGPYGNRSSTPSQVNLRAPYNDYIGMAERQKLDDWKRAEAYIRSELALNGWPYDMGINAGQMMRMALPHVKSYERERQLNPGGFRPMSRQEDAAEAASVAGFQQMQNAQAQPGWMAPSIGDPIMQAKGGKNVAGVDPYQVSQPQPQPAPQPMAQPAAQPQQQPTAMIQPTPTSGPPVMPPQEPGFATSDESLGAYTQALLKRPYDNELYKYAAAGLQAPIMGDAGGQPHRLPTQAGFNLPGFAPNWLTSYTYASDIYQPIVNRAKDMKSGADPYANPVVMPTDPYALLTGKGKK